MTKSTINLKVNNLPYHQQILILKKTIDTKNIADIKFVWNQIKKTTNLYQKFFIYTLDSKQENTSILDIAELKNEKIKIDIPIFSLLKKQTNPDIYSFVFKHLEFDKKQISMFISAIFDSQDKKSLIWLLDNYLSDDINNPDVFINIIQTNYKNKNIYDSYITNHLETLSYNNLQFISLFIKDLTQKKETEENNLKLKFTSFNQNVIPIFFPHLKEEKGFIQYLENLNTLIYKCTLQLTLKSKEKSKQIINKL